MTDEVDHSRRRLLTAATVGTGVVGARIRRDSVYRLLETQRARQSVGRSGRSRCLETRSRPNDESRVARSGRVRGPPRQGVVDQLGGHDDMLADPKSEDSTQPDYIKSSGAVRARNPEYWVGLAVCTHLGCSPLGAFAPNDSFQVAGADLGANWPGGFYCPCHGSKYDLSGRVFKSMPAPKNLTVPPYAIGANTRIVIGVDDASKPVS